MFVSPSGLFSQLLWLVMTGSSSALIKYQFRESLVGRKQVFELYPLSFDEFLRFKEESALSGSGLRAPDDIPAVFHRRLSALAEEYMRFGSYPKVVLSPDSDAKQTILLDLGSSYILKDIKNLFKIGKIDQLNHLVRYLAANIGKEISLHSLATELALNRETLANYIRMLEESYIIRMIRPFHHNLDTELRKSPKVYFMDTGIRNILIPDLNALDLRADKGALFENFVYLNLFHNAGQLSEIRYWRTRNKQEIDFIVKTDNTLRAFQCKLRSGRKVSYKAWLNAYPESTCNTVVLSGADPEKSELFGWQKLI